MATKILTGIRTGRGVVPLEISLDLMLGHHTNVFGNTPPITRQP